MKTSPLISVNIRTFNSEKTLPDTLQSVKNQTYKNIEILVSDGYSKDKSVEIAKKYGAKIDYSDNLGDARYQNFKNSKGKFILSLDSDQIMDKKLIEECVNLCEKQGFNALIISEKSIMKNSSYLENVIAYDKWLIDRNKDTDAIFGATCPRFYKKDLLKDIKWPKGLGIFDDTILYSQLIKNGAKVQYVSNQSVRHHEVVSWVILFKKFHRYGKSYYTTFKHSPGTITVHSLPRRIYFSLSVLTKPKYFFGLILLYLVKSIAAVTGVIVYIVSKFPKLLDKSSIK